MIKIMMVVVMMMIYRNSNNNNNNNNLAEFMEVYISHAGSSALSKLYLHIYFISVFL